MPATAAKASTPWTARPAPAVTGSDGAALDGDVGGRVTVPNELVPVPVPGPGGYVVMGQTVVMTVVSVVTVVLEAGHDVTVGGHLVMV